MINYKATPRKLVMICWYLFDYETYHLSILADLFGKETSLKSTTATKMLMYAIAADMILKGEY